MVQENCASQSIKSTLIFRFCARAICAVRCSMTVESLPPEKETQMREKVANVQAMRSCAASSTLSCRGYLYSDMFNLFLSMTVGGFYLR